MRKIFVAILTACFACGFARADDAADKARAATRQPATQSQTQTRNQTAERGRPQAATAAAPATQTPASRGTTAQTRTETPATPAKTRAAVTRKVAPATQATREAASRAVQSRAAATGVVSRAAPAVQQRGAAASRAPTRATQSRSLRPMMQSNATRTAATAARNAANGPRRARAAATQSVISSPNTAYGKCKSTFFSCMDEFCANKDSSLRRCACSARLHEFDDDKAQLEAAAGKLSDFSERLVAVNMDKADAAAMSTATEGENAYNSKDISASQKALDDIIKKINATTTESKNNQSLNTFNLATFESVDMFDTVDNMLGAGAASKEGDALYKAAYPTCKEMADEVCDAGDFNVIQSAYKMAIEQDCNTLSKNYASLKTAAVDKTKEAGALLDMSRLTNQQDRNSADMLSCSKQMMSVFETGAVCGSDLSKCLDWSGKYIDPMTGGAILSSDLSNLSKVLTRPTAGQKWSSVPTNQNMVRFIDAKKTYIEPATKNCENIKDAAWSQFVDDALGRIKAAQTNKLEQMRQNCTTLVGQCKVTTEKTIADFDSRALSIFGVSMDTAVNKMCSDIQNACGALMAAAAAEEASANEYADNMKKIDLQKTYATILQNCKIIGQECVRVMCQTNESQFGLCFDSSSSQRSSILNTSLNENICYNDVIQCVGNTPADDLKMIEAENPNDFTQLEKQLEKQGVALMSSLEKITRNIWGSCDPEKSLTDEDNKIITGTNSVLSWFGGNTTDSCYSESCPSDSFSIFVEWGGQKWSYSCQENASSAYEMCAPTMAKGGIVGCAIDGSGTTTGCNPNSIVGIHNNTAGLSPGMVFTGLSSEYLAGSDSSFFTPGTQYFTNCCLSGVKDGLGNCCETGGKTTNPLPNMQIATSGVGIGQKAAAICDPTRQCCFNETQPTGASRYCLPDGFVDTDWNHIATNGSTHLFCLGTLGTANDAHGTPSHMYGESDNDAAARVTTTCSGTFVKVYGSGIYRSRLGGAGTEKYLNYFYGNNDSKSGADKTQHHNLFVYFPERTINNTTMPAGFYNSNTNNTPATETIIGHRVAYCENGFNIDWSNNVFSCCNASDGCVQY